MTGLRLAPHLTLPLEAITETIALLGIRGSGKTNTAAVYAEELLSAGQQVVILDPTDAWWGLKSSADGQTPGFPVVVLGGKHQDLPLASTDGALIAEFVIEHGASVICSLRGFESKQQELRFATDFLRRLYYLKGQQDAPAPLALIIDEASRLVPQRVMGEDAACVGAVQQIVRQGRSSGFGIVLIDQRAATVNKDVLAQLEMLVAHRTTSPQDRKALKEWIDAHDRANRGAEFLESLASLAIGEAWVWSPGWLDLFRRVKVRARRTFDSSRTPRAGETVVVPKKLAEVDLAALRTKLAATIEEARANDAKALKARIRELERTQGEVPAGWVSHETMVSQINAAVGGARAECRVVLNRVHVMLGEIETAANHAMRALSELPTDVSEQRELIERYGAREDTRIIGNPRPEAWVEREVKRPSVARAVFTGNGPVEASPSEQKLLNALALMTQLRIPLEKTNLGFLAGYSEGGRFNNLLGGLRSKGLIDGLQLTAEGAAIADAKEANVRSVADLHALWRSKLSLSEWKVLHELLRVYPQAMTKPALGDRTDYSEGGRFNNILGRLRSLGAIDYPKPGQVAATDVLFPKGLR